MKLVGATLLALLAQTVWAGSLPAFEVRQPASAQAQAVFDAWAAPKRDGVSSPLARMQSEPLGPESFPRPDLVQSSDEKIQLGPRALSVAEVPGQYPRVLQLLWTPGSQGAERVQRAGPGAKFKTVSAETLGPGLCRLEMGSSLPWGSVLKFRVVGQQSGEASNVVSVRVVPLKPEPPAGLALRDGVLTWKAPLRLQPGDKAKVELAWNEPRDFVVQGTVAMERGKFELAAPGNSPAQVGFVRIRPVNFEVESDPTDWVRIGSGPQYPPPSELAAQEASDEQLKLSWKFENDLGASGFKIESGPSEAGPFREVKAVGIESREVLLRREDLGVGLWQQPWFRLRTTGELGDSLPGAATKTSGFLLSEIPGLKVWLSASAVSASAKDGDPVSSWPDLVTPSYVGVQSSPLRQPHYQARGLQGRPSLSFDGEDVVIFPELELSAFTALTVVASPTGMGMVYEHGIAGGGGPGTWFGTVNTTSGIMRQGGWTQSSDSTGRPPHGGGPIVATISFGGTRESHQVFINHVLQTQGRIIQGEDPGLDPWKVPLKIGGRESGYGGIQGDISEVLFFDRVLSTEEREKAERRLLERYGIRP